MYDIFISYRRGIGDSDFAGRVFDYLSSKFAVYFDRSEVANPIGSDFPQRLLGAIQTCRIAIIVIGPQWISQIARLSSPDDWVAMEVSAILSNSRISIIPIYRSTDPNDLEGVPPALRRLTTMHALLFDSFETAERNTLSRLIDPTLASCAYPSANSPFNSAPLVIKCNRESQWSSLKTRWPVNDRGPRSVVTIFLSGFNDEDHKGFLERILRQNIIEERFGLPPNETTQVHTVINAQTLKEGDYQGVLLEILKDRLLNSRTIDLGQVQTYLQTMKRALIVTAFITDEDLHAAAAFMGRLSVREILFSKFRPSSRSEIPAPFLREVTLGFAKAWDNICKWHLELSAVSNGPIKPPMVLWLNISYLHSAKRADLANQIFGKSVLALPELGPVTKNDIVKWINDPEVSGIAGTGSVRRDLENLADLANVQPGRGRIHMRHFRERAQELLSTSWGRTS